MGLITIHMFKKPLYKLLTVLCLIWQAELELKRLVDKSEKLICNYLDNPFLEVMF